MTTIILDSGPIISLAMNNLLWLFSEVKKKYDMNFIITSGVKAEVVDNPLNSRRFKFEAMQVAKLIEDGTFTLMEDEGLQKTANLILELANQCFSAKERNLHLVHYAEMHAVAAYLKCGADAMMIDERTTRYLVENPNKLKNVLRHKLHTDIVMHAKKVQVLKQKLRSVRFIRSAEFVTVAFEKGMLDRYLPKLPNAKGQLLDALLWGLKLHGCAISEKDLRKMKKLAKR